MITHLGARAITSDVPPYFVAELGPNFVVSRNRADNTACLIRMIDEAAEAGADCVKLQLKALDGFYRNDDMARPPHDPARSPFKLRGEYVLAREPDDDLLELVDAHCARLGIHWTASVWDAESVEVLRRWNRPWVKVASACVSDLALLERVRSLGIPVVMSTGMSTIEEVDRAVMALGQDRLVLAHCTAAYPCAIEHLNLGVMRTLRDRYHVPVGWSSHSTVPDAAGWATSRGARWIEYHLTLDRGAWGPDHSSSVEPAEFARAVHASREAHAAIGAADKTVLDIEQSARARLRRVG